MGSVQMDMEAEAKKAAAKGDIPAMERLIARGFYLATGLDVHEVTVLHVAVENGRAEMVEFLLAKGVPVDVCDRYRRTPLMFAAFYAHTGIFEFLVGKGADIHLRNFFNWSLFSVADPEQEPIARLLFSMIGDKDRTEILFSSAQSGNVMRIRALMSLEGFDIHSRDPEGNTALHIAAYDSHPDVVRFLVAAGLDVNAENQFGDTPLAHATLGRKSREIVAFLLSAGADVEHENKNGLTALDTQACCDENADEELVRVLRAAFSEKAAAHVHEGIKEDMEETRPLVLKSKKRAPGL